MPDRLQYAVEQCTFPRSCFAYSGPFCRAWDLSSPVPCVQTVITPSWQEVMTVLTGKGQPVFIDMWFGHCVDAQKM